MKKYFRIFYRNRLEQIGARIFRRPLNAFAKRVICRAYELRLIDSHIMHELAGLIDHSLWPERYSTHWVDASRREAA